MYENLVKTTFASTYPDHKPLDDAEISAVIYAYYPIPKSASRKRKQMMLEGDIKPITKPDTDNAYSDDSHVTDLTVMKRYSDTPRVYVLLKWQEDQHE